MAKFNFWVVLGFSALTLSGCFAREELEKELQPKVSEHHRESGLLPGQYALRIFGGKQPYVAFYHPKTDQLLGLYKVMILSRRKDFWPQLAEDARMTREQRYFAITSVMNPDVLTGEDSPEGQSFRADIFRGEPFHKSAIAANALFKVDARVYSNQAMAASLTKELPTHVFIGDGNAAFAVPLQGSAKLIQFSVVDGVALTGGEYARLAALSEDQEQPKRGNPLGEGCNANFHGSLLAATKSATPSEDVPFNAICTAAARASL